MDKLMEILGKAAFLGFHHHLHPGSEPEWDRLSERGKAAWIAAAHEALMINHIILQGPKSVA